MKDKRPNDWKLFTHTDIMTNQEHYLDEGLFIVCDPEFQREGSVLCFVISGKG